MFFKSCLQQKEDDFLFPFSRPPFLFIILNSQKIGIPIPMGLTPGGAPAPIKIQGRFK